MKKIVVLLMGKSGCGKSTLERNLIKNSPNTFTKVVSSTTRPIRPSEQHGRDYYFLSDEEYDNTNFIQVTEFAGSRYGSSVAEYTTNHECPILCVVPNSAVHLTNVINERYPEWSTFNVYFDISNDRLKENMKSRGDTKEMIEKRISRDTLDEEFTATGLEADMIVYDEDLNDTLPTKTHGEILYFRQTRMIYELANINWNDKVHRIPE